MEIYRITPKEYLGELSGIGAAKKGARWNSKGVEMVYTASSIALAMTEVGVYINRSMVPDDHYMVAIYVPNNLKVLEIADIDLPAKWNHYPHLSNVQNYGDEFIDEGKYPILKVPSAIVPGEYNYLLNPYHKDFKKIKPVDDFLFNYPTRLFGGAK